MPETEVHEERLLPGSLDDLRGRTPDELRQMLQILDAHLKSLHQNDEGELRELTDDEESAFNLGVQIRTEIVNRLENHARIAEVFRRQPQAVQQVMANIRHGLDGDFEVRRLTNPEARDRALRILDSRDAGDLSASQKDQVERFVRRDHVTARRILVTENEDYRSAWLKMVTEPHPILTPEENRAVQAWYEFRAMGDVTGSAGGMGIPVFIDPSIILTAQESGNPFLSIARQVTVNTNQWKGVSSAGVTWAFQTEAAATTDNSPVLAQPSVLVHMARGFIPFSIEVGQDYPGFASEMSNLLAQGYDELLVQKFTIGSGTAEPKGILTALSATAGDRVVVGTPGSIVAGDPYKLWAALPQKYRRGASWLMSIGVNNAIRQLGAANVFHGYTVNLPSEWADQLFGKPVYESPYMPPTTTWTTTAEGQAIVGDFSNFVVARNGGMSVELVPHIVSATASPGIGFPTAQRGWFAYARIGSDASNVSGFRLLVHG
jgi:HK97 family phage major capsid protein